MTIIDEFAVMFIGRKIIIMDLLVNHMNISIQDCAIYANLILFIIQLN